MMEDLETCWNDTSTTLMIKIMIIVLTTNVAMLQQECYKRKKRLLSCYTTVFDSSTLSSRWKWIRDI